jgi:hypothetical protein
MSAFAGKLSVRSVGVNRPEDGTHLEIIQEVYLPLMTSPDTVVPVPLAQLAFDIDKESALKFANDLKENAEQLKDTSKLDIATDLGAVEAAAEQLRKAQEGKV